MYGWMYFIKEKLWMIILKWLNWFKIFILFIKLFNEIKIYFWIYGYIVWGFKLWGLIIFKKLFKKFVIVNII